VGPMVSAYGECLWNHAIHQYYAAKSTIITVESVSNPDVMHCSMMSPHNPE